MLYGIIADIHSNLEAFSVVLKELEKVEKIICLGDIVGYGPDPNECIKKIMELNISIVAGNHEKAATKEMELKWFNDNARLAILWTQKEINQKNLEYLKTLPLVLEEDGFQFVHGSLREPLEEYISSISDALPTFEKMTKPLCFVGHFHKPFFIARKRDGNYDGRILLDENEIFIENYEKIIINVGAVGQPRDGDPRASYGIYDSKTRIFSLHRVGYDIEKVQEKMRKAGLPGFLIERLQFGR